ncbi:MAG: hypothetical protein ACOY3P_21225 [Planctomycetota bacterium]
MAPENEDRVHEMTLPDNGSQASPSRPRQFTVRMLLGIMLATSVAMSGFATIAAMTGSETLRLVLQTVFVVCAIVGSFMTLIGTALLATAVAEAVLVPILPDERESRAKDGRAQSVSWKRVGRYLLGGLAVQLPVMIIEPRAAPALLFAPLLFLGVLAIPYAAAMVMLIVCAVATRVVTRGRGRPAGESLPRERTAEDDCIESR